MNNSLFNLPVELQDLIFHYNYKASTPEHLMHKIMLYSSHPVADLFKLAVKSKVDDLTEIIPGEDFHRGDDTSFAHHFFHDETIISEESYHIYYYAGMDYRYVNTLNELETRQLPILI